MDLERIIQKIQEQDVKLDAIYTSVEKTRKYFLVVLWSTILMFILPLIALIVLLPMFLSNYTGMFNGLL